MTIGIAIGLGVIPTAARPAATTAPVNVVKPFFEGPLTQGQSAEVNPGSWTGLPSPNFTYAIKRGATTVSTDPAYVWTSADVAAGASAMTVAVTATNDIGPTTETSDPVTIAAPLQLSGTAPAAPVGSPYSFTPTRTGGHAPFTFALTGTLPTGLSFSTSTGAISGTPIASGTATLSIGVVDSDGLPAALGPFNLVVSAAATAAITSLEIVNAALLDATGDYGDATARTGVNGNGWVAKAVLPWSVGQTFDPTKISLTISDPGYDATGTTTQTRTIYGGDILRRQYSAQASKQQANDGVTLTVYFSLSDWVYAGSTVTGAEAASGFYGAAASGAISAPTNNSTLPYTKALFEWANDQHDVAPGSSTFPWEAVAYHRHMRNGRQVARIEVTATDASGHTSAASVSSSVALSAFQTQGNDVEVFSGAIALSALNQGELCIANAKVYPWIGDSSAVLDLLVDGISTTGAVQTANPQTPLRFVCDKTGGYTGAVAYVKAGVTGGAVGDRGTPFPTINAALAAFPAWNNANKGHNDHSGSKIRLMDDGVGGAVAHIPGAGMDAVAVGHCWTDIEADPLNTAEVSVLVNASRRTADLLRWKVKVTQGAAANYLNSANANGYIRQAAEAPLDVTLGTSSPLFLNVGLLYLRNVTIIGASASGATCMAGSGTSRTQCALALGVVMDPTANVSIKPFAAIGCKFTRTVLVEHTYATIPNWDPMDGMVVTNNHFLNTQVALAIFGNSALVRGLAFVQNVLERAVTGTSAPALQIGGDGSTAAMDNVVFAYNTIPGKDGSARANVCYTDALGSVGVAKTGFVNRFNLLAELNTKTDTFTTLTTATGRVGNWANRYTVGHLGWVGLMGDANGNGAAGSGGYLADYLQPSIAPKVGTGAVTFTNDKSGAAGAGGGDYHLTGGSNAAYGRVPTGLAGLSFDIAGAARLNNSNGAAGAYERP